ncbi:hypothetical protein EG328_009650 [Venturia inaequalis]|uniref:Uncharacterized protein n=1 Tax=Venturia inaequalis TaxID=5025 RepID=A0A8H3YQ27_VENIN|nr:hypothetical protein EG328_009650 [Venturia inaequalis]KAE9979262.1 hypothetical protein EG327_007080 [Venturia inaequalis]
MNATSDDGADALKAATTIDLALYKLDSSAIGNNARKLLINYSGIPEEEVGPHVDAIVADGVPLENTYGSDLEQEFIDLGYDLFQDKGKIKTTFLAANVFDDDSSLTQIYGQMSIVYTGSFFHLFGHEEQFDAAKRVVQLLTPAKGTMIVGRQVGTADVGDGDAEGFLGEKGRFRYNPKTWTRFWDEVGEATGTKWKVEAELDPFGIGYGGSDSDPTWELTKNSMEEARRMRFVVTRV